MIERPESTMPQDDAVELLLRQHQEIRRLFQEVEGNAGDARAEAFARLSRFLAMHETVKEEIVHPLARRSVHNGDRVIDARLEKENRGKRVLQELEEIGLASPEFEPLFASFHKAVLQHAEREEHEEFPELRPRSNAELHGMAVAIRAAEATAPTHLRPGMESVRKDLLLGSLPAVADRIRDLARKAMGRHHG